MENKAKPRICEALGVEVSEKFAADYPYKDLGEMKIREDGNVVCGTGKVRSNALCYMINHPESIHKIPRWTPEEVELAKAIKTVWSTADRLVRIRISNKEFIRIYTRLRRSLSVTLEAHRFPSLKFGESALISDIIGGGDENA